MKKYLKDGRTTSHRATIYGQMCGCRCWWKMLNNPWSERSQNGKGKSQKKKEKKKEKKVGRKRRTRTIPAYQVTLLSALALLLSHLDLLDDLFDWICHG